MRKITTEELENLKFVHAPGKTSNPILAELDWLAVGEGLLVPKYEHPLKTDLSNIISNRCHLFRKKDPTYSKKFITRTLTDGSVAILRKK